ncbi:Tetratricopeptide repeat protein [Sulfidibacter corallicola]|uniref:Tetratricopeptide repeat protein n=1 Tax=Sulfidibacter corallicola TaxID=2818388 RepID=A0A8A4TQ76_SULCO|nr:tetratricopeptide repeat protein [Sulfidibacter corallicola]QTD51693.1 tetratricopeptide repeat protein [Sulfidibacter corallicola]
MYRKMLGEDHYFLPIQENMLGVLYLDSQQYPKAETHIKRGLSRLEAIFEPTHNEILTAVINLGEVYNRTQRAGQADALFAKFSSDEPSLLNAAVKLRWATSKRLMGDFPPIADLIAFAAPVYGDYLEPGHRLSINLLVEQAHALLRSGNVEAAREKTEAAARHIAEHPTITAWQLERAEAEVKALRASLDDRTP